jgi:hypothetical protein
MSEEMEEWPTKQLSTHVSKGFPMIINNIKVRKNKFDVSNK